jgi:uncharacterized zinc-type alcohol dehydrogenase-like protein
MNVSGYAARSSSEPLAPFSFERRTPRANDVSIDILYCGVCHSDLHHARNDWGSTLYPCVPGHEIVGRVSAVGSDVRRFNIGDSVAVGCMVDSCQVCDQCHQGNEQYCRQGNTMTYGGRDRVDGSQTFGGYAKHIVVREEFVLQVPKNMDLARVAPLVCAGITTYSPLREWGIGPGSRVAVIGMGGLGHMGIKLAVGLGAHVTVISRSKDKESDALELGADAFLVSGDDKSMVKKRSSFDFILDTVPVKHDLNIYTPLLDIDATLVMVGQLGPLSEPSTLPMIFGRRRIAGSLIGGIEQTQELLDFCGRMNILPETEAICMEDINTAYERMEASDVRYRFVVDMGVFS